MMRQRQKKRAAHSFRPVTPSSPRNQRRDYPQHWEWKIAEEYLPLFFSLPYTYKPGHPSHV
jgi:hypothetical protein